MTSFPFKCLKHIWEAQLWLNTLSLLQSMGYYGLQFWLRVHLLTMNLYVSNFQLYCFNPIMSHKECVMGLHEGKLGSQHPRVTGCCQVREVRFSQTLSVSSPHKSLNGGADPWSAQEWLTFSHNNLGQEQSGREEERKRRKRLTSCQKGI